MNEVQSYVGVEIEDGKPRLKTPGFLVGAIIAVIGMLLVENGYPDCWPMAAAGVLVLATSASIYVPSVVSVIVFAVGLGWDYSQHGLSWDVIYWASLLVGSLLAYPVAAIRMWLWKTAQPANAVPTAQLPVSIPTEADASKALIEWVARTRGEVGPAGRNVSIVVLRTEVKTFTDRMGNLKVMVLYTIICQGEPEDVIATAEHIQANASRIASECLSLPYGEYRRSDERGYVGYLACANDMQLIRYLFENPTDTQQVPPERMAN